MTLFVKSFISILFISSSLSFASLVGETANFNLDKDPQRTSSMIKSGTVKTTVVKYIDTEPNGPAYQTNIDYDFRVTLMGNQKGTEEVLAEESFFAPEFLEKLRQTQHYEGQYFKADHKGYADATTLDGHFYPNCDKVYLYDIKDPRRVLGKIWATISGRADLKDPKILAHVYPGVPVLGGVKLDVAGISSGMKIKFGLDYVAP